MNKYYIGIDGGATNIKAGIVDGKGKMLEFLSIPTQSHLGKKIVAKNVVDIINALLSNKYKISAIGLAWPGKTNIPIAIDSLKKILEKKYSIPLVAGNDANLFTLGEAIIGKGKKYKTVVGITIGTGLGSGVSYNKILLTGRGAAAEFGHVSINFDGPKCNCGNTGCLEQYTGAKALKKMAKKNKLDIQDGEELYNLAKGKNIKALKTWEDFGRYLGIGLTSVTNVYDPDIIILGGEGAKSYNYFASTINNEIKSKSFLKKPPIKKSNLKNAAIIGAALFAKQNIK